MLYILLLALLLAMVAACVAFAVEMSELKSEMASFQQPQSDVGLQDRIQQLNRSINQQAVQFHSALKNTTQQLQQLMGARDQYASFPLDSCAALPPSFPSGHYWVRTSTGSAVLVYCDPTRLCGGVTGGWESG